MCGRFFLDLTFEALLERYGLPTMPGFPYARGEITPSMTLFTVTGQGARPLTWGMDYEFMKRPLINARLETVLDKPLFKEHFEQRRCLVPAVFFYEWNAEKEKFQVSTDVSVFSLAGLYRPDGKVALITREAGGGLGAVHHREPIYVPPHLERRFLESDRTVQIRDYFLKTHPAWRIEKTPS